MHNDCPSCERVVFIKAMRTRTLIISNTFDLAKFAYSIYSELLNGQASKKN